MFRIKIESNLPQFVQVTQQRLAHGARNAAVRIAARAKLRLRDDIRAAGLGDRLANTWRANVYPESGAPVLNPAALVYSKAPLIVSAFSEATTIRAKNAVWLAIPTENVPSVGGHRMSPHEVEARFDQDLIFIPSRTPNTALAGVDKHLPGRLGRWRGHGARGAAPQADRNKLTIMFVLARQVHLAKRLDWPSIRATLEREWPEVMGEEIAAALNQ